MNTVVSKLLDVDRQARQMLDEARQYYDKTIEELGQEKERLRQAYAERAAKHLADVHEAEAAHIEEAAARTGAKSSGDIRFIEETYERCHARWEEELFLRCVGRRKE